MKNNRLRRRHIDQTKPIRFLFNGKSYKAFKGDSIASALLANDIKITNRSFKYRRPRGIVTADVAEPNALMQIEKGKHTIPNAVATTTEIYQDMVIESVNCWPSPKFDLRSITQIFSRFMPAGFYYKTFKWPISFWKTYEEIIRKAAGFGKSPTESDPSKYDSNYTHCEILVVGSGPSGLVAALEAAKSGARVILADENPEFGGSLLYRKAKVDGKESDIWAAKIVKELASLENVTLLKRSTVFAYYDHNLLYALERKENHLPISKRKSTRERVWKIKAKKVILATGALERPLLFENNDKPGVMLSSAIQKYFSYYGVNPGENYIFYTNNDSAYKTIFELVAAGVKVEAVIDTRAEVSDGIKAKFKDTVINFYQGYGVIKANGCSALKSVTIQKLNEDRSSFTGEKITLEADLLAVSGGWSPVVHLSSQSGAKASWNEEKNCFMPGKSFQEEISVGSCNGIYDLSESLKSGVDAAVKSVKDLGFESNSDGELPKIENFDPSSQDEFFLALSKKNLRRAGKQFVDFQNDVTASDIELAASEGYHSIEHVKRYTALGFGTDQGKLGNVLGMNILAKLLGKKSGEVGTTTFRPNYTPVSFGAVAGMNSEHLFAPVRKTPIHYWHEKNGATFEDVGDWKRAWYYSKAKESMDEALNRETLATHDSIGIMDASTLGKIDIQGPDAAEFLNLIYTNPWLKLGVGKCRYGIMLSEDGMVMDDGVTMRLAENHFVMTTTTGGAAKILTWLEHWLQTEWPHLKVYLTSVTDHFTAMAISGPNSRKLISKICPEIDFSNEDFPFMSFKDGLAAGVPARILRISFTGELSYEIHLDANYARYMWEKVMKEGKEFNITPYGTETMHILRAEKGFIIVGQDTDGTNTPQDLGMDWAVSKKKIDFLGKRSLDREGMNPKGRRHLVGLLTTDPKIVIPEGSQVIIDEKAVIPAEIHGHVTSSYFSAVNDSSIAMALIKDGFDRIGETVYIPLSNGTIIEAKIAKPIFYDPKGDRQNV